MEKFTKQPEVVVAIISVVGTAVGTLLVSVLLGFLEGRIGLGPVVGVITFLLLIAIWVLLTFRWGLRLAGGAAAVMVVVGSVIFLIAAAVRSIPTGVPSATPVAAASPTATETPVAAAPTATEVIPTPTPVEVTATPVVMVPAEIPTITPLEGGERLDLCGDDLCIFDHEGAIRAMLLEGTHTDFMGFSWSPDGSRVVFGACPIEESGCRQDLFIAKRDGSDVTVLLRSPDTHCQLPVWSPDGEWIAHEHSCDLALIRPDRRGKTTLVPCSETTCAHFGIAWSPDSQRIAWVGGRCSLEQPNIVNRVWVINRDGSEMHLIFQSDDPQLAELVAWSPDGESVAVTNEVGISYLIDADCYDLPNGCDDSSRTEIDAIPEQWLHTFYPQWAGEEVISISPPAVGEAALLHTLTAHTGLVESVAWSPDGTVLASGGYSPDVILWDAETGERLRTLEGHADGTNSVAWSPDGTVLASGGDRPAVILWDAEAGEQLRILEEGLGGVVDVAFSPDGTRLAVGDIGGLVVVWSVEAAEPLLTIQTGHTDELLGVEWSVGGTLLATCSYDHTVVVWDAETGERLRTLEGHDDRVRGLSWSPVGPRLASGSHDDGTVIVWNPETGERLHTLTGLGDRVSVEWSPDGAVLATGLGDGTLFLWDEETFDRLLTLSGHASTVESIAWSPDGTMLATGSYDHTVIVWRVGTASSQ